MLGAMRKGWDGLIHVSRCGKAPRQHVDSSRSCHAAQELAIHFLDGHDYLIQVYSRWRASGRLNKYMYTYIV